METRFTPEHITELNTDEIFVFGSNKAGNHAGGAARLAVEKFGAVMGQAEGPQGQSYAIPTLDEQMQRVSLDELTQSVRRFSEYSMLHIDKTFFVTKIGCGIAGFSTEEIAEVFKQIAFGPNVILPEEFGEEKHIIGYKGFDKDMTCRGFQFREGETFEEDVEPEVCSRGFHFCESPFSILDFRPLLDEHCQLTPIHMVVGKGKTVADMNKAATTKIQIGARLDLPGFVKAGVDFLYKKCIVEAPVPNVEFGNGARIGSSGYGARIGSSGDDAQIGSSGDIARIGSSGYGARIGSSGYDAQIGSSGNDARIGSSGNSAQIGSSGNGARIGSSGYGARIGSSGYDAQIGSSGNSAQIGSSGDSARIGSSGYDARIESSGHKAVIAAIGRGSIIKAKKGSWITLAEYDANGAILWVKSAQIDDETLKENVYYRLRGGEFVKVEE